MIMIIIHDYNQEMELGLETEGRNKLVSDFVTATFQVKIVIMIMVSCCHYHDEVVMIKMKLSWS